MTISEEQKKTAREWVKDLSVDNEDIDFVVKETLLSILSPAPVDAPVVQDYCAECDLIGEPSCPEHGGVDVEVKEAVDRKIIEAAQHCVDDHAYLGEVRLETVRELKEAIDWAEVKRREYEMQGGGYVEVIHLDNLIRAATSPKSEGLVDCLEMISRDHADNFS